MKSIISSVVSLKSGMFKPDADLYKLRNEYSFLFEGSNA